MTQSGPRWGCQSLPPDAFLTIEEGLGECRGLCVDQKRVRLRPTQAMLVFRSMLHPRLADSAGGPKVHSCDGGHSTSDEGAAQHSMWPWRHRQAGTHKFCIKRTSRGGSVTGLSPRLSSPRSLFGLQQPPSKYIQPNTPLFPGLLVLRVLWSLPLRARPASFL